MWSFFILHPYLEFHEQYDKNISFLLVLLEQDLSVGASVIDKYLRVSAIDDQSER